MIYDKHCYALTNNDERDFANINEDNVLGIFSLYTSVPNERCIRYFMTNAKFMSYRFRNNTSDFKKIGHGMDTAIKEMFPDKIIHGYSEPASVSFWENEGYEHLTDRRMFYDPNHMIYEIL
ncbi:MAG: hypothetical protein MJ237_00965 [bacterium]|nr:hypothetical protein [bacterium]